MRPFVVGALNPFIITLIVIAIILLVAVVALYFLGKRAEKKQEEQQKALAASAQTVNLFIIDKKKMKLKDAGLPKIVMEQTPKYLRGTKTPIVRVKAGARVMNLMCDPKIFDQILPKQEGKATVSGIYLTAFRRTRGPVYEPPKKKKFMDRFKKDEKTDKKDSVKKNK